MDYTPVWLDADDVRGWLRDNAQPPASDDAELNRVCSMTEAHVQRCRPEWTDPETAAYAPDAETYQGAVMYAAKHLRRRNSPGGIETFGDIGVSFVSKYDPDIDRALHTGDYSRPGVG